MRGTMSPALKAEWVAALRSGKYRQGAALLAYEEGGEWFHCCLGVACELFAERAGVDVKIDGSTYSGPVKRWGSLSSATTLPWEIAEFVGLRGEGKLNPFVATATGSATSLATLNDAGYSFERIADFIEEQL